MGFSSEARNQTEQSLEMNSGPISYHSVISFGSEIFLGLHSRSSCCFSHFNQRSLRNADNIGYDDNITAFIL